ACHGRKLYRSFDISAIVLVFCNDNGNYNSPLNALSSTAGINASSSAPVVAWSRRARQPLPGGRRGSDDAALFGKWQEFDDSGFFKYTVYEIFMLL
ncbi:MAG: hypothetical protein J5U19_12295, partial [Candidatus Methanoperedens sp.]|nr:hypothetical protein [Candidatus Methanoperedens sp.]